MVQLAATSHAGRLLAARIVVYVGHRPKFAHAIHVRVDVVRASPEIQEPPRGGGEVGGPNCSGARVQMARNRPRSRNYMVVGM